MAAAARIAGDRSRNFEAFSASLQTVPELQAYTTFINGIAGASTQVKARGHSILNHRDPPKDAVIGGSLSNNVEGPRMRDIIKDLYYLRPSCGICGPGNGANDA